MRDTIKRVLATLLSLALLAGQPAAAATVGTTGKAAPTTTTPAAAPVNAAPSVAPASTLSRVALSGALLAAPALNPTAGVAPAADARAAAVAEGPSAQAQAHAPSVIPTAVDANAKGFVPTAEAVALPDLPAKAAAYEGAASRPGYEGTASRPAVSEETADKIGSRLSEFEKAFGALGDRLEPPAGTPKTLKEATLEIDPKRQYLASPEDWRDEVFYMMLLDRFAKSKDAKPLGDPKSGITRHGGDIKGVTEKLDYIKASGVTTILMSPVTMGIPEAYHGYAPTHLLAVDPHLGTMEDFKTMVREAHKRGIRVIMDLVINHTGPVFEYKNGSKYDPNGQKEIGEWTEKLYPEEMAKPEHFDRKGVIDDWNNHDQATHGDFPPNYRHWASHREETQKMLIHVANWWLKETDVDGFRLDAIRHMDAGFVGRFGREVRAYAAQLGKKNFFLLGENSTGVYAELKDTLNLGVDSAYNYPEYRRINHALHGKASARSLEDSFNESMKAMGGAAHSLVRFIDNHDVYRFLRPGESIQQLKLAFAYLLFSTGIPMVYYGTEQAFRQLHDRLDPEGPQLPADPQNREDMFAGGYESEYSKGDNFNQAAEPYLWVKKLSDLRRDIPALRRGEQFVRWSDPYGAGIYAFSRIYQGEEVVVVVNTSGDKRDGIMWVDANISPAGTHFEDALDQGYSADAFVPQEGGSKIRVDIPPHGVRVLVRKAK